MVAICKEDAGRLGYTTAADWQALVQSCLCDIARGYKIQPDHLRWYAAFHQKENSVHIHMVVFSSESREGFLTKQGIQEALRLAQDGIQLSVVQKEIGSQDSAVTANEHNHAPARSVPMTTNVVSVAGAVLWRFERHGQDLRIQLQRGCHLPRALDRPQAP